MCSGGSGPALGRPLPAGDLPALPQRPASQRNWPSSHFASSSGQIWQRLAFTCTSTFTNYLQSQMLRLAATQWAGSPNEMKVAQQFQSESLCRALLYLRVKMLLRSDAHTLRAFFLFPRKSTLYSVCSYRSDRGRI